jgi:hypothetical protein
MYLLIYGMLMV